MWAVQLREQWWGYHSVVPYVCMGLCGPAPESNCWFFAFLSFLLASTPLCETVPGTGEVARLIHCVFGRCGWRVHRLAPKLLDACCFMHAWLQYATLQLLALVLLRLQLTTAPRSAQCDHLQQPSGGRQKHNFWIV
jgi:hypothetical protein